MEIIDGTPLRVFPEEWPGRSSRTVDDELPFYRKQGRLRARPLRPPDDPFTIVGRLIAANPWEAPRGEDWGDHYCRVFGESVLDLVRTAFRFKGEYRELDRKTLAVIRLQFKTEPVSWSERLGLYVRGDGSHDPVPKRQFEFPGWKRIR